MVSGQVNIKVGYTGGNIDLSQTDLIFDRFNTSNPSAQKGLGHINYIHGLEIGVRHMWKSFGLELGLVSMSGDTDAAGITASSGALSNVEWKSSATNYYVGFETHFGAFGIGSNIGYQQLKYKAQLAGFTEKKDIYSDYNTAVKVFLILEHSNQNMAFSLRPFVSFSLNPYDIRNVELEANPGSTIGQAAVLEKPMIFGFSILFYNGPQ